MHAAVPAQPVPVEQPGSGARNRAGRGRGGRARTEAAREATEEPVEESAPVADEDEPSAEPLGSSLGALIPNPLLAAQAPAVRPACTWLHGWS